jgi:hypothetical protein
MKPLGNLFEQKTRRFGYDSVHSGTSQDVDILADSHLLSKVWPTIIRGVYLTTKSEMQKMASDETSR